MNVTIVDRSPIFIRGLISILAPAGWQVVNAGTRLTRKYGDEADLFIVDAGISRDPGAEQFLRKLAGEVPMLLLVDPEHPVPLAPEWSPPTAFINRGSDVDALLHAIETMGCLHVPTEAGSTPRLSDRERQVLQQVSLGRTNAQVARRLAISEHTVDTYLRRIRAKLGLGNKADLTRAALARMSPGDLLA